MSTQKRGEDIYAYTRILKYRNKRYGLSLKDVILLFIIIMVTGYLDFYLNENTTVPFKGLLFFTYLLFLVGLLFTFIDFAAGMGLFSARGVSTSAVFIGIAIAIVGLISFKSGKTFTSGLSSDVMAMVLLLNLIVSSIGITYYAMTSTPHRQGKEQIIRNLNEIKSEVSKESIAQMGVRGSLERATKWLQFKQTKERIWGVTDPLYETSEILRAFFDMGKDLSYSWKDVVQGNEDIHRLDQTFYLILENIEKANLQPETTILSALTTVAMVNPENLSIEDDKNDSSTKLAFKSNLRKLFDEFTEELSSLSEWDFVSELEKLEEDFSNRMSLPPLLYFARIFHFIDDRPHFFKCAEILADTFNVLINRSDARFSNIEEKEISNYVLGLMYNTLGALLRKPVIIGEDINDLKIIPDIADDFDNLPGSGDMALPSFDDFEDMNMTLPSMDIENEPTKMNISVSMASARNLIRRKQEIDGSWSARIDSTAECIIAVLDRESAESDFIKVGVHYLLALQEKNGSWQNDELLTSLVTRALYKTHASIGGF